MQTAMQSHCSMPDNMDRYGRWWINSHLTTSEHCPTYKSINGLQRAITQSLHHITIPGQLSVHWLINQIPSRWKQWPLRWWHLLSQQTTLEELRREVQKGIIPNYRCTADSQARGYNFTPSRRSVARVSISFHVLPVVKCEQPTYLNPCLG